MKVLIPSALHSYTGGGRAEARGASLGEVLVDLERQYPGIRFRIIDEQSRVRRHIRIFVNGIPAETFSQEMQPDDDVVIVQALSGG